jgi:Cu(I)/Ag(I) efflux system membrane protein CusA/SilA
VTGDEFRHETDEPLRRGEASPPTKSSVLESLIRWSLGNRFLVLMLVAFVSLAGVWALRTIPLDAIPDLSDPQVIVQTTWDGASPQVVEDQITQVLSRKLVSTPGAHAVRGYSFFGQSLVYVVFEDGTDLYWARSRVQEMLAALGTALPRGVSPKMGPDASGVGWIYQYGLVSDPSTPLGTGSVDNKEMRRVQDWVVKPALQTVSGVSEVASVGGQVRQFQVTVDPVRLAGMGLRLADVESAIRTASADAGGEAIETAETEWMIRTRGLVRSLEDLRGIPVRAGSSSSGPSAGAMASMPTATPVATGATSTRSLRLEEVATVTEGPAMRRGVTDLNGDGDVVAGIVVMRYGQNARTTIEAVKAKLEQLRPSLPAGTRLVTLYDRSTLIDGAVKNLAIKLLEEMLIVGLVCGLFLFHARSALVAIFTLPVALLAAFLVMRLQGIGADIMSLGDSRSPSARWSMPPSSWSRTPTSTWNTSRIYPPRSDATDGPWSWKVRWKWGRPFSGPCCSSPCRSFRSSPSRLRKDGSSTRWPTPRHGRWRLQQRCPVTLVPVLIGLFLVGRIPSEASNPVNRLLVRLYHPVVALALRRPWTILVVVALVSATAIYPLKRLGSEFMPPLFEGDLLYMPTVLPGISVTKAKELLQQTDRMILTVPEVEQVFGKSGPRRDRHRSGRF